jgi:hypothetical protein
MTDAALAELGDGDTDASIWASLEDGFVPADIGSRG